MIGLYFMPATTGVYPERSRRAPRHVWRGRPRPRNGCVRDLPAWSLALTTLPTAKTPPARPPSAT